MIDAPAQDAQAELLERLDRGLGELGLDVGKGARVKLVRYLLMLQKWNETYNLTAIREAKKAVSVHLLDSMAVAPFISGGNLLDVGSGAGLPGIPLAVARPGVSVTLLDSNHKKTAFLIQAIGELGLENAKVVCQRVESWRPPEKFDCIVSRAFSDIAEFAASTCHLLAPGGVLAAMKGIFPFEELERLSPDFRVRQVRKLSVPFLEADRHLVLLERA